MRRFFAFAALLGVALVLGCQDVGTGPAGSDGPQFHVDLDKHPEGHGGGGDGDGGGGDNPGSPFYEYTFTKGPLTMDLVPAGARPTVGNSQAGEIVLRAHFHDEMEKLNLSAALVDQFGARTCFGGVGGVGGDDVQFVTFSGVLRPTKKNKNDVKARFFLGSKNLDGDSIVYLLDLEGDGENATGGAGDLFPPEDGETMTVTFDHAFLFAQSPGEKNACTGEYSVEGFSSVEVTGRLTELLPPPSP